MTVLRIGAAPIMFRGHGLFFSGDTPRAARAILSIDEETAALHIALDPDQVEVWSLEDLRQLRDQAGRDILTLHNRNDPVSRLMLTDREDQRILTARAPFLHKRAPVQGKGRLAALAAAAVGCMVITLVVLIPLLANALAPALPLAAARALGDATYTQIRAAFADEGEAAIAECRSERGDAALDALGRALFPEGSAPEDLRVRVLDGDMVNAFALPGGRVVFFRGLLDQAQSAEEVAAVYAHEVGHVVARDPVRIALRSAGSIGILGLLFGDFAGGAVVVLLAERLVTADYTQQAEADADAFAHAVLSRAGVPASAMADFFDRLRDEHGDTPSLVQHFMAHPTLGDRAANARASTPEDLSVTPILTAQEWSALQSICSG